MRKLNEAAWRYLTYQTLLESGLNSQQRERLIEAGIVQKVLDWFGAGGDAAKEFGGAAMKLFKDAKFSRRMATAEKNIAKELNDLLALAEEAGQPEEAVWAILKNLLEKAGVSVDEIQKAAENPPEAAEGGAKGKDGQVPDGTPAGEPIKADSPQGRRTIAAAAAEVAGQDPAKAADNAEQKEMDPKKLMAALGKTIGDKAGTDPKVATSVISALLDSGVLMAENRRRVTVRDLKVAINEVKQGSAMFERWEQLAGLNRRKYSSFLFEGVVDDITKEIESKKIKDFDGLKSAITSLSDDDKKEVEKEVEKIKTAYTDAKAKDADKFDEAFKEILKQPAGKDAEAAKEAKEKYKTAFENVSKKLKDVDPGEIAKVFTALDALKILQLKEG